MKVSLLNFAYDNVLQKQKLESIVPTRISSLYVLVYI